MSANLHGVRNIAESDLSLNSLIIYYYHLLLLLLNETYYSAVDLIKLQAVIVFCSHARLLDRSFDSS